MSPDRDSRLPPDDEPDDEFEEEEAPRSIFAAVWFRVVLVLLGVAVVGAVAVPYVLDVVNAPSDSPASRTAVAPPSAPATPPAGPSAPPTPPAPTTQVTPPPPAPGPARKTAAPPEGAGPRPAPAPARAAKAPEKAPAAVAEAPKREPVPDRTAAARPATPAPTRVKPAAGGDYFVQVGAFREQETAKKLAARLREQNYPVDESVTRAGGAAAPRPAPAPAPRRAAAPSGSAPDRYDVVVSGGSPAEINAKLSAKGLASEPAGDGVRIRPSLPLRDAVALSKDLGSEGFKVQVRRGGLGGASPEPAPAPAPASTGGDTGGGQTLYRVRVGGYPDRAAALAVQRELQEKGYQSFVAKGRE